MSRPNSSYHLSSVHCVFGTAYISFAWVNSLNPHSNSMRRHHYYPHFTDEGTEHREVINLPGYALVVPGKAVWTQRPSSNHEAQLPLLPKQDWVPGCQRQPHRTEGGGIYRASKSVHQTNHQGQAVKIQIPESKSPEVGAGNCPCF